jgi:2-desacetyl-2-hydroxyethyl bacteriochlorophyllide A dehydrogenase
MKTIYLDKPYALRLTETDAPTRPSNPDEAIVRVRSIGICGTDLHAYKGNQSFLSYPRILGHELGVEVIAVGDNAEKHGIEVGDRCAVIPYLSCGECVACRRGKTNCCTKMQVLGVHVDGGMREWLALPMNLLRTVNSLPYEHLAQVEMLAIGAHAVRRAKLELGENVLVIGAGPIGLGAAAFAREAGARVILQEVNDNRLNFCRHWEMTDVIDGRQDVAAQLQGLLDGEMPTAVFDATGNPASMMNAVNYVAHGGSLTYVGHVKGELTFSDPELHKRELTLYCSRNATADDFTQVLAALEQKHLNPDSWITNRASFDSLVEEFPGWLEPDSGVIKAVLNA